MGEMRNSCELVKRKDTKEVKGLSINKCLISTIFLRLVIVAKWYNFISMKSYRFMFINPNSPSLTFMPRE